jgi:hypothetical protein
MSEPEYKRAPYERSEPHDARAPRSVSETTYRRLKAAIRQAQDWRELNEIFALIQQVPRIDWRMALYHEYEMRLNLLLR